MSKVSGILDRPIHVDMGIIESIANYILRGWDPGGGCTSLLTLDRERAEYNIHPLSRPYIDDMIELIQASVPEECYGTREIMKAWCAHQGFQGAPNEVRVKIKLSIDMNVWWAKLDRSGILKGNTPDLRK